MNPPGFRHAVEFSQAVTLINIIESNEAWQRYQHRLSNGSDSS